MSDIIYTKKLPEQIHSQCVTENELELSTEERASYNQS